MRSQYVDFVEIIDDFLLIFFKVNLINMELTEYSEELMVKRVANLFDFI